MRVTADTHRAMWRLITAYRQSRSLGVAAELGIPELLAARPRTATEIAVETGTHKSSVLRLLRLLMAIEVLTEDEAGRFHLTPLGEELREDRLGSFARYFGGPVQWRSWLHLDHSIKTGERGFDLAFGMRNWEYYATHPADATAFDAAMRALTVSVAEAVAAEYDFSRLGKVTDVGGGDGTMLIAILRRHPHVRGVLLDRPDVVERARSRFQEAGLIDRVEFVGGSFFEDVPPGADAYLMKSILHDWDDDEAIAILQRCHAASAARRSPTLIVERVLSDRVGPDDLDAVLSDLNMLVNPGGRERTTGEYTHLFERAGFRLNRTLLLDPEFHILEALPV